MKKLLASIDVRMTLLVCVCVCGLEIFRILQVAFILYLLGMYSQMI